MDNNLLITDKHVFFWNGWPSNWCFAPFKAKLDDGSFFTFQTSEQYFMWRKAIFFGDEDTAKKILESTNPRIAKQLGREVVNFDEDDWDAVKYEIMYAANEFKYSSNKDYLDKMLSPEYNGKTFVEASPYDKIWGIGMHMSDEGIDDETNWKGQNLLGKIITEIRDNYLKCKQSENKS